MRLSVLIADDEPHARRYIKELLSEDEDVEVVYECKNGQEVLNFFKTKEPNVIFLDINMPGISGVEVADKLKSSPALVIFSTAYDQYALKAFEVAAFDYLLKPYGRERFLEVLQRAKLVLESSEKAMFGEKFEALYNEYKQTTSPHLTEFKIKEKGFERIIHVNDILYIEASTIYAVLHLNNGTALYRVSLNLLEQQLPPNFVRVHRSFILNDLYVSQVKYLNNSTYMIVMKNKDVVISSRRYNEILSKKLKNL